jgi:nucleoside-diphosphate-sugar epimerase
MTILITGASGLIGTALTTKLQGEHAVICHSRSAQPPGPGVTWVKHDLAEDSWEDLALPDLDIVYHLAGQTSTYNAKNDPIADLSANVLGFLRLLDYLKGRRHPAFVVLAGTATEVGLTDELPIHEGMPDRPITFYDISKLTAEMYLRQYVREGWVRGCALRLSNVFGRSQPGQRRDRGIIDKVFGRAVSGQSINIYGNGDQIRDYIFIDDVVSAFTLAPIHAERTNGRAFLIGTGKGTTLKDAFMQVIAMAASITGTRVELEHVAPPAGLSDIETRNAVIDASAYTKATGWSVQYNFDEGLAAAYRSLIRTP